MEKQIGLIVDSKLSSDITKKELKQIRRLCKIFPNIKVDFDQIQLCKKESTNLFDIIKCNDRVCFLKNNQIFDEDMKLIGVKHNNDHYLFDQKVITSIDLNFSKEKKDK